jgi:uroporphyrinogen-III decarboxylase
MEERYLMGRTQAEMEAALGRDKKRHCVFGKTGGPYLRTTYVRGEQQFLMDIAGDPPLAKALADKMAVHLAAVGTEQLRRWSLHDTGIFIYDDMAHNLGPMFSPRSFEKVFLPAYLHMIRAYKEAGARYVFLHSDGDIRLLLDMLVDAGIDGINPLERRANMDSVRLRELYPSLVLIGGMDNTDTLINGPVERVIGEAREIIELGREGGVVIGTHSVSPEIPLEHFVAYRETCLTVGQFA